MNLDIFDLRKSVEGPWMWIARDPAAIGGQTEAVDDDVDDDCFVCFIFHLTGCHGGQQCQVGFKVPNKLIIAWYEPCIIEPVRSTPASRTYHYSDSDCDSYLIPLELTKQAHVVVILY